MGNIFKNKETFKKSYESLLQEKYNLSVNEASMGQLYKTLAILVNNNLTKNYEKTNEIVKNENMKKTIYFSMEFLMGRLITNNLQNSGYYNLVKEAFQDYNIDLNKIEDAESDTGLGNGGLGRLAACFLDSAASIGLPLYGNSIRYSKGFFIQEIVNNNQIEKPDPWLEEEFMWEEKKIEESINIAYYGQLENSKLINPIWVKAVPYDVNIVGDSNQVVTHLRLWKTEPSEKYEKQDMEYLNMVEKISEQLYPDDSTIEGKELRLQQQYLLSATGVQNAIKDHLSLGRDIRDIDKYYTFQINDTHPTLVIPELMRVLMDEHNLNYETAWNITKNTVAFTNHTIMQEALERWDIELFKKILPRIYEIIEEINKKFIKELQAKGYDSNKIYELQLIDEHTLKMANICIVGSYSVNGVAALHTEILKNETFKDFYQIYPDKFNNKTNGITHRRWLLHINNELTSLLDKYIGTDYRKDLKKLEKLLEYKDNEKVLNELKEMKHSKKVQLANRIKQLEGIEINPNSIFDIQVKRLHEYKRQLLNILHIIYLYNRLKSDQEFKNNFHPQTFIFGAKAAPTYYMAKRIIELINSASEVINNDEDTNHLLKVVFVVNYNVTYAEYIMTAADLSEQISTASKEASGTGNMKFMMNGALTIGTMDGANVEIVGLAGEENNFIFGLKAPEVLKIYEENNYNPKEIYENDQRLKEVFNFIETLNENPNHFDDIKNNLLNNDYFLVLKDFDAYVKAQEIANQSYKNSNEWFRKVLINIAKSGFFTSDRTIEQYNNDIWNLKKIK